jgi:hypothetical protein
MTWKYPRAALIVFLPETTGAGNIGESANL